VLGEGSTVSLRFAILIVARQEKSTAPESAVLRLSKNLSAGIVKGQGPLIYNRRQGRHVRPQVRPYGGFAAIMRSLTAKPP